MKLSKKTMLYSCILAMSMVLLIVGYFIWMLPALYVSYMEDSNYEDIMSVHNNYMKNGNYDNAAIKNPMSAFTLNIPEGENEIYMINSYMSLSVLIKDEEIKEIIRKMKETLGNISENPDELEEEEVKGYFKKLKDKLIWEDILPKDYPVKIYLSLNRENDWKEQSAKVVNVTDHQAAFETSVTDGNNYYTAYYVIEKNMNALTISMLSVITPGIREIRPIILQSLPMIIAVIFFLMLILSHIFSDKIVTPIINLANYARELNLTNPDKTHMFVNDLGNKNRFGQKKRRNKKNQTHEKDEIMLLGETLNELYEKLYSGYILLEEKNQTLIEDNKRQEVFLKASSHQLKTPIAAALLLVDGMIDEIGKYKNTKETLPKVKEQILSMKKIVEEILYLNHSAAQLQLNEVYIELIVEDIISAYQVQIQDKEIQINREGEPFSVYANSDILKKIIDNLMSNAVNHSVKKGRIDIIYEQPYLIMYNKGDTIPDDLIAHVFEPFVSSDTRRKGKGLGLYVVSWYGKLLHIKTDIKNNTDGVQVRLQFSANNIHKNFIENSYESDIIGVSDEVN